MTEIQSQSGSFQPYPWTTGNMEPDFCLLGREGFSILIVLNSEAQAKYTADTKQPSF